VLNEAAISETRMMLYMIRQKQNGLSTIPVSLAVVKEVAAAVV